MTKMYTRDTEFCTSATDDVKYVHRMRMSHGAHTIVCRTSIFSE